MQAMSLQLHKAGFGNVPCFSKDALGKPREREVILLARDGICQQDDRKGVKIHLSVLPAKLVHQSSWISATALLLDGI